jgi:hypothetical protein
MMRSSVANASIFLVFFLFLAVPGNSAAFSGETSRKSITIDLLVKGDAGIKDEATRFITRKLDSIPHRQVVPNNGDWELSITILKRAEYIASVVIIKRISTSDLKIVLGCDSIPTKLDSIPMYVDDWQLSDKSDSLKLLCEKIVADFDTTYLQKWIEK